MSNDPAYAHDLEEVLLRVLNREASADETERLNQALTDEPELRSRACRFLAHDSLLKDWIRDSSQAAAIAMHLPADVAQPSQPRPAPPPSRSGVFSVINHHGLLVGALAATLLVALLLNNLALRERVNQLYSVAVVDPAQEPVGKPVPPDPPKRFELQNGREIVGRVAGLRSAVWTSREDALTFGDHVEPGQTIDLKSGVVELLLVTGAKVTIEGPAVFHATSASESRLSEGRLAAAAPRLARGYTVVTPTSELVDIGTQFGVVVEQTGESELHVFDGDVVARKLHGVSSNELLHAKQDEAMRFDSTGAKPIRFAARERDFVRRIVPLYREDELPRIPVTSGLTIWYAADRCGTLAEGDRVSNWRDLLIGDNDFSDDAWQFEEGRRPVLVHDGAGRPAIRFNGWSTCLATSPMEASSRQTTFVVCSPAPVSYANSHHGQMLYKYGDSPSLELTMLSDFSARGWVWPGSGKKNVGVVRSKPIDTERVAVIAYNYDPLANRSELWVNGESQGRAEAPTPIFEAGRRYIGRHKDPNYETEFFGNIYEVVVYDASLDGEQMPAMWEYFSERYQVD